MTSMEHNNIFRRTRTEAPSDMRKLGKDIKVRLLPSEEAKKLKSGCITNRKVTKDNMSNSSSWGRDARFFPDRNNISSRNSSSPFPPGEPVSNSLENVAPKPQVPQTVRKANDARSQISMLKRKCSEVEDRLGRSVILHRKGSSSEDVGLEVVSKELRRDKKCSGEVNISDNTSFSSVHSSSLEEKFPATKKLVSHQEAQDFRSKAVNISSSMNKDNPQSGTVSSSPRERNLQVVKASGAMLPVAPRYTKSIAQENNEHNIKYIGPAQKPVWRGNFEIPDLPFNTNVISYEGIIAHPSARVSRRAYEFSKQMLATLHFTFLPQSSWFPKTLKILSRDRNDIALYFYPDKTDKLKERNYGRLLKFLVKENMMLKSCMGDLNLLVFPSTILKVDCQKLGVDYFMWGVYCATRVDFASADAARLRHPM